LIDSCVNRKSIKKPQNLPKANAKVFSLPLPSEINKDKSPTGKPLSKLMGKKLSEGLQTMPSAMTEDNM